MAAGKRPRVTDGRERPLHVPLGRHPDGQWLYAPLGSLTVTRAGAAVVCHACGEHLEIISGGHLKRHGLTGASYRERYGLNRSTSLAAPRLLAERATEGHRRYASIPEVSAGLSEGQQMAQDGRLLALSHQVQVPGSRRTEGRLAGRRLPQHEQARHLAHIRRERRAAELGYPSLSEYVASRRKAGWGQTRIARELSTSVSWVARWIRQHGPTS